MNRNEWLSKQCNNNHQHFSRQSFEIVIFYTIPSHLGPINVIKTNIKKCTGGERNSQFLMSLWSVFIQLKIEITYFTGFFCKSVRYRRRFFTHSYSTGVINAIFIDKSNFKQWSEWKESLQIFRFCDFNSIMCAPARYGYGLCVVL